MKLKLILFTLVLLNIIPFVSSQYYYEQSYGFLSGFSLPFFDFSFANLVDFYLENSSWIDFFIVLGLLVSLFQSLLKDSLGKQTPIFMGIILALGFAFIEKSWNFHLGYFGPVALLIFIILLLHILHKQHEGKPLATKLGFLAFALFLLWLFWGNIGDKINNYFGTGFDFDSSWLILMLVLGLPLLALFLYLYESKKESSVKPTVIDPDLSRAFKAREAVQKEEAVRAAEEAKKTEEPGIISKLFSKTPDGEEYKKVSLLVTTFIENTKDPDFKDKEDFILRRYNATKNYVDSFLAKYPQSKHIKNVHELLAQLNKAFEDYSARKSIYEQIQQNLNYLESVLTNEDEPFENLERAKKYIDSFYSEYERYIKADQELNARINSLIIKLNNKLKRKPISQETLEKIQRDQLASKELSQDALEKFREQENRFEQIEKRVRGFLSSFEDILAGRMSKEDYSSLYKQTQSMLSNFINSVQSVEYKNKAEQYQEDVKNNYEATINEYNNLPKKQFKEEKHEISKELDGAEVKLNYSIANANKLPVKTLVKTLTEVENTFSKYYDINSYYPFRNSVDQLRFLIAQRQPTDKNYRDRELYELRSTLSRAIANLNKLTPEQVNQTVNWAENIYNKYYDPAVDAYSGESLLIKELKTKFSEKGRPVVGILDKIKNKLILNVSQFHKVNKELKKFSNLVSSSKTEDKQIIESNFNKLIQDLNKLLETTDDKQKVMKLKNELSNKKLLYDQKIQLQDLINELNAFVNLVKRGDIALLRAKKTYSVARKKFTEIEEGPNRDDLKQGLDIVYNLVKEVYDYITEFGNINLIEHEIDKIREKIRKHIFTAEEARKEREKLIPRLESLVTNFRISQVKKASLLGELRSGY